VAPRCGSGDGCIRRPPLPLFPMFLLRI
jgi:hypothetical protein